MLEVVLDLGEEVGADVQALQVAEVEEEPVRDELERALLEGELLQRRERHDGGGGLGVKLLDGVAVQDQGLEVGQVDEGGGVEAGQAGRRGEFLIKLKIGTLVFFANTFK